MTVKVKLPRDIYLMDVFKVLRKITKRPVSLFEKANELWVALYWRLRLQAMGEGARVSKRVVIYRASRVSVGARVIVNDFVHIWGGGGVEIGADTLIAAHCAITSVTHDSNALTKGLLYRDTTINRQVRIGANVWIGSNAVILPGVTIGDGAIIAAGAVVTRDVKARVLVAGVPGRVVRKL
jgi:maltose O-acetyltransferase